MKLKTSSNKHAQARKTSQFFTRNWWLIIVFAGLAIGAFAVSPAGLRRTLASGRDGKAKVINAETTAPSVPVPAKTGGQSVSASADGLWRVKSERSMESSQAAQARVQAKYRSIQMNRQAMTALLSSASLSSSDDANSAAIVMTIPTPDGAFGRFRVVESPIMEPQLAAQHPEIRTYSAVGIDDPHSSSRFSWTPSGFEAIVLSAEGTAFIQPESTGNVDNYLAFYNKDVSTENVLFSCGMSEPIVKDAELQNVLSASSRTQQPVGSGPDLPTAGDTLRTYRLAVATTAEWTSQFGPDTTTALAKVTSLVNQVNAIYQRDLAINFVLVAQEAAIIFTDTATDGYDEPNTANSKLLGQNQSKLDATIGSANYDIGHVFGGITVPANNFSFSGIANIGVACATNGKARGASTWGGTSGVWTPFIVGGIAHEIGHQFSAMHTFNATTNTFCSGQRSDADAYEPGSGSTLMGYSTCDDANGTENLQRTNDLYFHSHSIDQITTYVAASGTCATSTPTGHAAPAAGPAQTFTIPANTPFALTAQPAGGNATYNWEEYDPAGTHSSPPNTDDGFRPLFRSYPATANVTRNFPSLQYILGNANVPPVSYVDATPPFFAETFLTGESLPTTNRTMNFRLTVRDNQLPTGGISTSTASVTVVPTGAAFAVTQPNTNVTWTGGSDQTITWNVAGTTGNGINAANVKISLSTDGGQTFPTVLAASTPNDGTEVVQLPTGKITGNARIKVEGVGNIFFDISDVGFSLTSGFPCTYQLSSTSQNFDFSPSSGVVNVLTPAECTSWTATSNSDFITIIDIFHGVGRQGVDFVVARNTGAARTGSLKIAGQTFTVTQIAAPPIPFLLQFSAAGFTGSEASGIATLIVARLGSTTEPATVDYATADGTAKQNSDYASATGTLIFAPGETQKTITILINDDVNAEPAENFTVLLSNVSGKGAIIGSPATATVTIADNDLTDLQLQNKVFVADLTSQQVVPGTFSFARGAAILLLSSDERTARVSMTLTNSLGSAETGVHIHAGGVGVGIGTPVLFTLPKNGSFLDFNMDLTAAEVLQLKLGQWYIDVHTLNSPPGEIRGQWLANPMDDPQTFVQQHYLDFLSRVPDAGGLGFWTNEITKLGTDPIKIRNQRVGNSNAFFYEAEYQQTGAYTYRLYRAAYGNNQPFPNGDTSNQAEAKKLLSYSIFANDRSRVVGGANLVQGQQDLAAAFVARAEFTNKYPLSLDGPGFIAAVLNTIRTEMGVDLTSQQAGLLTLFNNGGRAEVMYRLADDSAMNPIVNKPFIDAEYNRSFVATQYFGYLRRDPEIGGFLFWLSQVNGAPLRDVPKQNALVCSFITSAEYQLRFSFIVSRNNGECSH
jgi:hypothetical protein